MKLPLLIAFLLFTYTTYSQNTDTLLYERFETGGTSFTLNSPDENGVSAAVGYNQWIINNAYTGGSGQLICSGFPTTFVVPDTPLQPAGITGGPSTQYMHMISDAGQSSGILNCSYLAANGLCGNDEYNFSTMSLDVNTAAYDSVSVSFLWLCAGATSIYGELFFSTDGGSTWTLVTIPSAQFSNQSSWINRTVSIPVFAGQASLRFGFRFVNEVSFTANDPGFAIDEFLITASTIAPPLPPPVAAFSVSDSSFCEGTCVNFNDLSANSPASWFWIFQGSTTSFSTQQNPLNVCYNTPGIYPVTLIVENAAGSDTLTVTTITVHANPSPPVITVSGDTLFATPGFINYDWFLDGFQIPATTGDTYIASTNGNYQVTATDSNGCSSTSTILILNTGLSESTKSDLNIYPNPALNSLTVIPETGSYELIIQNGIGEVVYLTQRKESNPLIINISMLPKACYIIKLIPEEGAMRIAKFLKM